MGAHDGCLSIFRACNPNIGVPRHFAKSRCGTPIFGLHALRGLSNCHLASLFQATLCRPCAPITFMLAVHMKTTMLIALLGVALIGCVRNQPLDTVYAHDKISGVLIFSEGYRDGGSIGFITIDDAHVIYRYFIHLPSGNYNGIYCGYSVPTNLAIKMNDDVKLLNEIIELTKKDCPIDVLEKVYQIDMLPVRENNDKFTENIK